MAVGAVTAGTAATGSFWNDRRFRGILLQALVLGLLSCLFYLVVTNTIANLEKRNIATGFWFLTQPAGFEIPLVLIPYEAESTHGRVFVVGLLNTIFISILGCIIATLLGFAMGVARLSGNWLLGKVVYWIVEFTRNVPLLLQIIFWYTIMLGLPKIRDSIVFFDDFYLSNSGLISPIAVLGDDFTFVVIALCLAILGVWALSRWARKRQETTGQRFPAFWAGLAILIIVPTAVYYAIGAPMEWEFPVRSRFGLRGGLQITPEIMAMLVGLSFYTAAFISEIVRAGILSVHKGQREAANALGMQPNATMRLIIIPQAMRVIIPPLASQYLNLTKNSSLGFAIGFSELTAVFGGISLNQTGQAIECMAITMAAYLTLSLMISSFMNFYNARMRLVER